MTAPSPVENNDRRTGFRDNCGPLDGKEKLLPRVKDGLEKQQFENLPREEQENANSSSKVNGHK